MTFEMDKMLVEARAQGDQFVVQLYIDLFVQ
jgi:hypothetical protein